MIPKQTIIHFCSTFAPMFKDRLHIYPEIPKRKLQAAYRRYRIEPGDTVLAVLDLAVFGGLRVGIILTSKEIQFRNGATSWGAGQKFYYLSWREYSKVQKIEKDDHQFTRIDYFRLDCAVLKRRENIVQFLKELQLIIAEMFPESQSYGLRLDGIELPPKPAHLIERFLERNRVDPDEIELRQAGAPWQKMTRFDYFRKRLEREALPLTDEQEVISINFASLKDLMILPGIDQKRAKIIVNFRNQHGYVTDMPQLEELLQLQPHEKIRLSKRIAFTRIKMEARGRMVDY